MASSTRQSLVAAKLAIAPIVASADIKFAEEIFAVGQAIAESLQLRSILSDPSTESNVKTGALKAVFGKSISSATLEFVGKLVDLRWSTGQDLVSAFEQLGVFAVASIAGKKLAAIESDLFAFQLAVDADQELQFALASKQADEATKMTLVDALIGGKVAAESNLLIKQAVIGARNRRVSVVLEQFGKQVSAVADRLVATVTVASALEPKQLERLEAILAKSYGQSLKLNVEIDESLIGGVKVQIADEIIDGSLASRLTNAKLLLA